jgi:PBSX family phage terminase large subunit
MMVENSLNIPKHPIVITSPKQNKSFSEATHRFNIWVGAVSSGKTFSSLERFIYDLKNGPPGDAMIIGVNRTSIQRNILTHLYRRLGFPCPTEKAQMSRLYGRDVWFVGAPDVSAVSTIQGSTLALAYVDEATNLPEPFWKMLESRLRVPGAKLLATCNPEGPAHWLKKDYIDKSGLDLICWNFSLEDNPTLDDKYKQQLKASYSGMWYNRYILGEWALAHGAIYDNYDKDNEYENPFPAPTYCIVGVDYGTTNATAAVLCAVTPNKWPQIRVEAEYYYDSAKKGRSKTDQELVKDIKDFIGCKNVSAVYVDPAAASLKIALRQAELPVLDANNDVLLGIKICSKFIGGKNIIIQKGCTILREHLQSYAWDPKAAERGEDKPVKKNDHILDALRYAVCTAFPQGEFSYPDENITHDQLRRRVFGDEGYGFMNPGIGYF